jgi:hypothetical protein
VCNTFEKKVSGAEAARNPTFIKFALDLIQNPATLHRMQHTTPHHSETCQFQLRGTILALHLLQDPSKGLPAF